MSRMESRGQLAVKMRQILAPCGIRAFLGLEGQKDCGVVVGALGELKSTLFKVKGNGDPVK